MPSGRGAFILFEGIDRCGKSTQCGLLTQALASTMSTEAIRFPNRESSIGQLINSYLSSSSNLNDQTIHLLFSANRWESSKDIMAKLESGTTLVQYAYSGVAFSSAKGMDLGWCKSCDVGLPAPDCVFYFDMPVDAATQRGSYGEERYEKIDFQRKVQKQFLKLKAEDEAAGAAGVRWTVIDAQKSIDEVHMDVLAAAQSVISKVQDQRSMKKPSPEKSERECKELQRTHAIIRDLEDKLAAEKQKNQELENEVLQLKSCLLQMWSHDQHNSDEGLFTDPSGGSSAMLTDDSQENVGSRAPLRQKSKSVIDSGVVEHLRIHKEEITIKERVGMGSFGIVHKAMFEESIVAVKVFISREVDINREIVTMSKTKGQPHVLDLLGVVISEEDPYKPPQVALVMKFMANGSLQDICYRDSPMYHSHITNETKVKFAYQAARGVLSLHQLNIIHRDLACRNLLVDDKMDVYVADFGFARLKHIAMSKEFTQTKIGPVRWEAPESLVNKEFSEKTDSFSFGVCLYELISGKQPWDSMPTPAMVIGNVLNGHRMRIPINCDPVLAELCELCWAHDPDVRPNFDVLVRTLGDRYRKVLQDNREVNRKIDTVEFMISGCNVIKFPFVLKDGNKAKKPKQRFLHLTSDLKSLLWSKTIERGLEMKDVTDILVGQSTKNFKLFGPGGLGPSSAACSFSIVTVSRTLDIVCESSHARDQWVWGLRFLLARQREDSLYSRVMINLRHNWSILPRDITLSSFGKKAKEDFELTPQILNGIRHVAYNLQRGEIMIKFTTRKTHARHVCLSEDLTCITWSSEEDGPVRKGRSKSILVDEIERIVHGNQPKLLSGSARMVAAAAQLSESLTLIKSPPTINQRRERKWGVESTDDRHIAHQTQATHTMPSSVGISTSRRDRRLSVSSNKDITYDDKVSHSQRNPTSWSQQVQSFFPPLPSLKRERSLETGQGYGGDAGGSIVSEDSSGAEKERNDDEEDYQLCVSYLGTDGRTLLAIRCPNKDALDLWTEGLTALIVVRKMFRHFQMPNYNSPSDFDGSVVAHVPSNRSCIVDTLLSSSEDITSRETTRVTEQLSCDEKTPHQLVTSVVSDDEHKLLPMLTPGEIQIPILDEKDEKEYGFGRTNHSYTLMRGSDHESSIFVDRMSVDSRDTSTTAAERRASHGRSHTESVTMHYVEMKENGSLLDRLPGSLRNSDKRPIRELSSDDENDHNSTTDDRSITSASELDGSLVGMSIVKDKSIEKKCCHAYEFASTSLCSDTLVTNAEK